MQRQAAFDLDRRDILPAADDHVVDAAGDEEITVAVEIPGIACEVPAVAQGLRVRLRPSPIVLERFIALQQRDDFAFLAGDGEEVRRVGAKPDHADHLVNASAAGRPRLCRGILVDGEGVDFRGAIVIDEHLRLECGLEAAEQTVRHRRSSEAELAHGAHVGCSEARVVQEVVIKRRHQIKVGEALFSNQRQRARSIEPRQTNEHAADQ